MFHGDFSPSIFFRYSSSFLVFAITIIYFISQHLGQEPPVTWISSCAGHYPEFLIFRFSTITGAVFILLGWMTNYFYLKSVSLQSGFNLQRYQPQIPMVLGMMGALFITVSTASIDTGVRKGKLHVHCAAGFFSCTLLAIFYNTALYWLVYNNTKNVSRTLLILKSLLMGVIVLIIIANESKKVESEGFWSDKDVYIQWIASYTVAAYMYAMGEDVKGFRYQYEQAKLSSEVGGPYGTPPFF